MLFLAYDLPNIDSQKIKTEYKKGRTLVYHKPSYGRIKKPRQMNFSTVNNLPFEINRYLIEQFT